MDDQLKLKIAATIDLPTDALADPEVASALDADPEAREYARSLHTLDRALRRWPARARSDADWEGLAAKIDAALAEAAREKAKARKGKGVTRNDADPAATPVFEDETPPMTESKQVMSEPHENDDLEGLAALTRTSTAPSGVSVPSVRPAMASISDAVDDTSSGIIDIKALAEMARDAPAVEPAAAKPAEAPAAKASDKPAATADGKKVDAKGNKKDDVMVTPARAGASSPAPVAEAPRKSGNTLWGAIGGMALMAGAFAIYTNMNSTAPSEATSASPSSVSADPSGAAVPEAQSANQAAAAAPAPAQPPQPEAPAPPPSTETVQPAMPVAAPVQAAPEPAPTVAAQPPAQADPHAAEHERVPTGNVARREDSAHRGAPANTRAPAREARVAPAATAPAAAPTTPPAAPAPAARPAATAPAATAAPAAHSVDDLMNRVAGANAAAAPVAAAAPTAELPERLTRSQVTAVLSGLAGAVRSCTNGQAGTAPVSIVINNDGTVSAATVSGQFAGSAAGECIAGVVRRAHFPRFRAADTRLTYPFVVLPPR